MRAKLLPRPSKVRHSRKSGGRRVLQRSEEHTSELQSRLHLVCRLLLEKKKKKVSIELPQTVDLVVNETVHRITAAKASAHGKPWTLETSRVLQTPRSVSKFTDVCLNA